MSRDGRLSLPEGELTWRFSRSSGAGGQHVNTSDTRVELIWSLDDTSVLSPAQKELARHAPAHPAHPRLDTAPDRCQEASRLSEAGPLRVVGIATT
jgi:protein subunit release factor B